MGLSGSESRLRARTANPVFESEATLPRRANWFLSTWNYFQLRSIIKLIVLGIRQVSPVIFIGKLNLMSYSCDLKRSCFALLRLKLFALAIAMQRYSMWD